MKSLIITVLLAALLAAAFFTRPNQDDFKRYIVNQQTKSDTNIVQKAIDEEIAKKTADGCTFRDRYLWVDVKQDGKTVYTGAFAHWFNRGEVKTQVKTDLQKLDQKSKDGLNKLQDKIQKI